MQVGDKVEVFTLSFGAITRGIITKIEGNRVFIKNQAGKIAWYHARNVYKLGIIKE